MKRWHIIVSVLIILVISLIISLIRENNIDAQIKINNYLKNYERLYELYTTKISKDTCNQLLHYYFLTNYLKNNKYEIEKAQKYYSEEDNFINCKEIYFYANGYINRELKKYQEAENYFLKAATNVNPFDGAYNSLGYMYQYNIKNNSKAIEYYKQSIKLFPNSSRAINNLFELYFSENNYEQINFLLSNKNFSRNIHPYNKMRYYKIVKKYFQALLYYVIYSFKYVSYYSIIGAVILMLLWTSMLYKIKNENPEKIINCIIAIIIGCFSPFIVIFIHFISPEITTTNSLLYNFFYYFFKVGPIEEFAKFISIIIFANIIKKYNDPVNSLLYGGLIAIGFATIENIQYFNNYGIVLMFSRFIFSVILHISLTGLMSYGYYLFINQKIRFQGLLKIFIFVSIMHGLYDFVLSTMNTGMILLLFSILHYSSYLIISFIIKAYFNLIYYSLKSKNNEKVDLKILANIYAITLLITFATAFIFSTLNIGFNATFETMFFRLFFAILVISYTYSFFLSDSHNLPNYIINIFNINNNQNQLKLGL